MLFERWHWTPQAVGDLDIDQFVQFVEQVETLYKLDREANT